MNIFPTFDLFADQFNQGVSQLVWARLSMDLQTPVSAMLALKNFSPYHVLFESVERGRRARYSIIALAPDVVWRCINGRAEINEQALQTPEEFLSCDDDPFTSLRALHSKSQLNIPEELPPMAAGLFGYMGYDMVRLMEDLPSNNPDTIGIAQAMYIRPTIIIIFDSIQDQAIIVTPVWDCKDDVKDSYENAKHRIEEIYSLLQQPAQPSSIDEEVVIGPFATHIEEASYAEIVRKGKEYVAAGDICQVVPSRRWDGPFRLPTFTLYRSLRQLNPSPYLFYVHFSDMALVGSSPEILVRLENNKVTIRPIAGTRPRGKTPEEDKKLELELLSDEKELSEHLMLLDLGRNDVGRVAVPGSVKVTEQMIIEHYSHVMHIVSNVEGELDKKKDVFDALIAGFPAGTLTGAPKIRAMEIIDELESEQRSFYGGTVGYFSANGSMDTCIAIRTGLVKDNKLYIQAGGGVVADSEEHMEFVETENKAKAIIRAAEHAKKFL